jgi:photosystem II stability/assembly factor-like uncharacterized protein
MRRLLTTLFVLSLALALPSGAAAAPVSVGQSGWFWGSPQPQGNVIRAVEFSGSRGYAAGEFGTVLRSDDAGASWSGLATGLTSDISKIRIVGGDTVIVTGACSVRRSDDAGAHFRRLAVVPEGRCGSSIASFSFTSGNVGYFVLQDGSVFRTDDGGATTSSKTAVPLASTAPTPTPNDIWFTSDNVGFAATSAGQIYRTTDGAASWTLVTTGPATLRGLFFLDANTGYAVGGNNTLMKTVDGGTTWEVKPVTGAPGGLNFTSIRCADANTCVITTESGNELIRTTDGGDNAAATTPSTQKIFGAAFASATRVVAAGFGGSTVVSDDAGQNFSPIGTRLTGQYLGIKAMSGTTAYAFGESGALARTDNGGESWSRLGAPTSEDLVDISFATPTVGFVLDSTGTLLRTDNGGTSWKILDTGGARPRSVIALSADKVVLAGPRGVRISTNGGDEFATVGDKIIKKAAIDDVDRVGNTIFAWSGRFLAVSTNGTKWKRLLRPSRFSLNRVDFVSNKVGFALDVDGRVWKTTNQGRKWTESLALGTSAGYDMAFSDANKGWITIDAFGTLFERGIVLRTTDSGKTWRPQLIGNLAIQARGLVAFADTGLALANRVELFATKAGGDQGTPSAVTLTTSKRKLAKTTTIVVTGKLSPAEGGEQISVARREIGRNRWSVQIVTADSKGTFTTRWKVKKTSWFVAQWLGDDDRASDGSEPLRVQRGALPKASKPLP